MKKMAALGLAVAVGAALWMAPAARAAETKPAPAPAAKAAADDQAQCVRDAKDDVQVAWLLSDEDGKKCADFDLYEADQLNKCKKECQGNRKQCEKRQRCGSGKCPDPGYCWKCVEH